MWHDPRQRNAPPIAQKARWCVLSVRQGSTAPLAVPRDERRFFHPFGD